MEDNRIDTDLDSWNTGNDKADIIDNTAYNPEDVSDEAKAGQFIEDEGDEEGNRNLASGFGTVP